MAFIDLDRARARMRQDNLDGLLAFSPNNIFYLSGYQSPLLQIFGPGAAAMVLLPADPQRPPAMIVNAFEETPAKRATYIEDVRSYPLWIEITTRRQLESEWVSSGAKPEQFDAEANFRLLAQMIAERGMTAARVGIEVKGLSYWAHSLLTQACPELTLVASDDLFLDLRRIKTPEEIRRLRLAAQLAERGMLAAVAEGVEGLTNRELRVRYTSRVHDAAIEDANAGLFQSANPYNITIGPDCFPAAGLEEYRARAGDIVKFDIGATVGGYHSDHGRTYVIGEADELSRNISAALQAGQESALDLLRPGTTMSAVFEAAHAAVHRSGFPAYTRGHVGHHLGLTMGEEPPFLSRNEELVLEPGMVLALEVPLYADGVGAFQLEDNLVITESGCESFTTSARTLVSIA